MLWWPERDPLPMDLRQFRYQGKEDERDEVEREQRRMVVVARVMR